MKILENSKNAKTYDEIWHYLEYTNEREIDFSGILFSINHEYGKTIYSVDDRHTMENIYTGSDRWIFSSHLKDACYA